MQSCNSERIGNETIEKAEITIDSQPVFGDIMMQQLQIFINEA